MKGLTQTGDGDSPQPNLLRRPRSSQTSKQAQSQSRPTEEEVDDDDIQEVLPVKTEAAALEEGGDVVSYEEETTADMLGYDDQHYDVAMEGSKGELRHSTLTVTYHVLLLIFCLTSSTLN